MEKAWHHWAGVVMGTDGLVDERVAAPSLSRVILHVVLLDSGLEHGRRWLKSTNLSLA